LTDNSVPDGSSQAVPADTTLFNNLSSRRFESVIRLQVIIGKSVREIGHRMKSTDSVSLASPVSNWVSVFSGKLHVLDVGSGPETIVLWPSIFTDHHIYDELVKQLSGSFRFLLIDGPGHGKSDGSGHEFTMAQCATALKTVLDHFGLQRAVIGGTSWGGLVAGELALTDPDRVKAILLLNTPFELNRSRPQASSRLIAWGARWLLRRSMFRNGVAKSFFSKTALASNPSYRQRFHAMLKAAPPDALSAAVRSVLLRSQPLRERLSRLTAPVLVVAGQDDEMYPVKAQADAAALLPMGRFASVAGKHISVVERPAEVAELILQFLHRETSS
jgi:3-oxoadipate enol-lactonase